MKESSTVTTDSKKNNRPKGPWSDQGGDSQSEGSYEDQAFQLANKAFTHIRQVKGKGAGPKLLAPSQAAELLYDEQEDE